MHEIGAFKHQVIENHSRKQSKSDHIGDGIEFFPKRPGNTEHSGSKSVEKVGHQRNHDQNSYMLIAAMKNGNNRNASAEQIQQGKQVGQMSHSGTNV